MKSNKWFLEYFMVEIVPTVGICLHNKYYFRKSALSPFPPQPFTSHIEVSLNKVQNQLPTQLFDIELQTPQSSQSQLYYPEMQVEP